MATTKQITIADVEQLPDDPYRYDLIRGELIRMAPAGWEHGDIATGLVIDMGAYVRQQQLGKVISVETGFVLRRNPDVLLVPDLAFIRTDHLPPDGHIRFIELAPDLVVEVISPSERPRHIQAKLDEYLLAGVRQVWIVRPRERTITIHTPDSDPAVYTENDTVDGGDVLPGFELKVADIFA